jgi:hypothetical protein
MTADLVLHWQLDHFTADNVAVDSSGNHLNGTVEGDPRPRMDGRFGSCLALDGDGDAVITPKTPALSLGAYTVQSWINAARPAAPPPPAPPTGTDPAARAKYVIALEAYNRELSALATMEVGTVAAMPDGLSVSVLRNGAVSHSLPTVSSGPVSSISAAGALEWEVWHHLAVTYDGKTARTYVDGVRVAQTTVVTMRPAGSSALMLGRHPDPGAKHLQGMLAHVKVYEGALGTLDLQRDMATDESALAAFVRTHPLDFDLSNADGQRVLYIDDAPAGQAMTLRLTNSSRQDLELRHTATPQASATDHHAALRFRPGTLDTSAAPRLVTPGWSMRATADATTFYLLCDATTVIHPGGSVELALTGVKADGGGGTRGTRVELAYKQMGYTGEPDELSGNRLQFLDVVNHRGRPDIPLDVGFVGGDRVLSDGTGPGSLRLRVADVSRDNAIRLVGSASAADAASAFVVSFDVQQAGEDRQWALTEARRAGDVHLRIITADADWTTTREDLGQRVQWTLTPKTDTALTASGSLDLELGDIYALASPGHAPIVVAYRNIPGFQDGFVSVAAERTPLLFTSANTGIGIAAPQGRLHVVGANSDGNGSTVIIGPTDQGNLRLGHHQDYAWVQSHGGKPLTLNPVNNNVGIGTAAPDGKLHIIGANTDSGGRTLVLGPTNASHLRLGHHQDYTWIQSSVSRPLALNPGGNNVGIGTTAPGARLTVSADTDHLQLRRDVTTGGKKLFLELYQGDIAAGETAFPSIRFQHANRFSHRIEARGEGIYFKDGDLGGDALRNIYAQKIILDDAAIGQGRLTIGDVTIGVNELRILKALADGNLQFDLQNVIYSENAYVDDRQTDGVRRYMVTRTSPPTSYPFIPRSNIGHWRIRSPFRASD